MMDRILDLLTYHQDEPMIFNSGLFLMLFLGFTLVYALLQRQLTPRLLFVTLFSYYFYYKSSGFYFFLLAVVTLSDFLIAKAIHRRRQQSGSQAAARWLVALSLLIDLGLLFYFKYTNFFAGMIAQMVGSNFQPWDIFLPVGISFFTFQSLSYTIDVYRGKLKPLQSPLDYAFYVSFFPQLVAGPIVRATDFVPQIRRPLSISREMFAAGVYFIIIGLFKKAVISDYISLNFVDRIFEEPTLYSGVENLLGVYGYALQIYCDFSGYSDMAIGIALLLGFRFPLNFDAPYKSASLTEFWRRWHISLSSWIRDYIYIPLGGNRKGKVRQYLNLFITWILCGLWHGASLNFVFWGLLHGIGLLVNKFFSEVVMHRDKHYVSHGWQRVAGTILTFHFVCLAWMFFRNSSFDTSFTQLGIIFGQFHGELTWGVLTGYGAVMLLMLVGYLTHFVPQRWENGVRGMLQQAPVWYCAFLLTVVIYIVIQVKSSDIQPFIYFQF